MNTKVSYDSGTHQDLEQEIERLRSQLLISWEKEARNLVSFGLLPGMSLLEMGCGPGFGTRELLKLVPDGSVTALETDPVYIERARRYLGNEGTHRVRFLQVSAVETGLEDAQFDFVVARFLFQHISDPVLAAREALRVLKPGGILVVVDSDDGLWGLIHPAIPEAQSILARRAQLQKKRGGDRLIGRQLCALMKKAGFGKLALEAVAVSSDERGFEAFLPQIDPERFRPLVEEGFVSEKDLTDLRAAREKFLASPERSILMLLLMVRGEKPLI